MDRDKLISVAAKVAKIFLITFFLALGICRFVDVAYRELGLASERLNLFTYRLIPKEQVKVYAGQKPLSKIIEEAADRNDVEPSIIKRIIAWESNNGQDTEHFEIKHCEKDKSCQQQFDLIARHSSHGLMHVLGTTAESECGMTWQDLVDTEKGVQCGTKYFGKLLRKYGSIERALLAYNGGGDKLYPQKVLGAKFKMSDVKKDLQFASNNYKGNNS